MSFLQRLRTKWPLPVVLFFIALFAIGYIAHDDYGVSSDEPIMLRYGIETYDWLFHGGAQLDVPDWRFHNPIVQLVMVSAQYVQGSNMGTDIWFLRHWLNFLMFFATILIFYRIATRLFPGWKLPLLGCAMFVISPRIFAHAFYNPKDIPALLFFTAAMLTLLRVREHPSIWRLVIHALACAVLISLRSFGLIVVVFTLWTFLSMAIDSRIKTLKQSVILAISFIVATLVFMIIVWPRLWSHPFANFLGAITDNTGRVANTLYFGALLQGNPWHYLFVWLGITTPVIYSLLFIIGTILLFAKYVRSPISAIRALPDEMLCLLWFWVPALALIIFHIGIFNEWRHVMFIYPGFLLTALLGLRWLMTLRVPNFAFMPTCSIAIVLLQICATAVWMVRNHPLEFAYFSVPSSWVEGNFEMDYWGLSYRQGLEYVFAHDKRDQVNVFPAERIAVGSALTLPLADWNRLNFVDADKADYIVDAFINSNYQPRIPLSQAIYTVQVDGLPLLAVYRGPDTNGVYADRGQ